MEQVQTQRRRIAKPLGLYIIAVFDIVVVGLIPLLTIFFSVRNSEEELPLWTVMLFVALPAFIMAASVWALVGDNAARYVLLALVTVWSILLVVGSVGVLASGEGSNLRPSAMIGPIVRACFWLAINWWYFNRAHVVEYFKQNQ